MPNSPLWIVFWPVNHRLSYISLHQAVGLTDSGSLSSESDELTRTLEGPLFSFALADTFFYIKDYP
jgi:hypothetical protein